MFALKSKKKKVEMEGGEDEIEIENDKTHLNEGSPEATKQSMLPKNAESSEVV
jgi:hypothetical protein